MNDETISQEASAIVVRIEGDLVAAKLPSLRSELRKMVGSGILHLTLDLAKTQMVDSSGIGLLISAHNSLKKAGGESSTHPRMSSISSGQCAFINTSASLEFERQSE
jgi:anti-anti-sigma factor